MSKYHGNYLKISYFYLEKRLRENHRYFPPSTSSKNKHNKDISNGISLIGSVNAAKRVENTVLPLTALQVSLFERFQGPSK